MSPRNSAGLLRWSILDGRGVAAVPLVSTGLASDADIEEAINAAMAENPGATAKQMGVVMKAAQAKLTGKRVDGKALSEKVRAKLS